MPLFRGGPPTRSAAGAARLYNLRLPPKASGKDTDLGRCPAPGLKGYRPCRRPISLRGKWNHARAIRQVSCISLKQQQDSCPKRAKRKPEKLSKRCLRNPLKRKKKMPPARKTLAPGTLLWNRYESNSKSGLGKPHPKASNSSRIRAQSTRNASPKNSRNVAYGTH